MLRVAAAVLRREGRILVARRTAPDWLAGLWELPGGKIEPGESPQECLVRELAEELGLTARVGAHLATTTHRYPRLALELRVYEAEWEAGEVELREHDAALWARPAELRDLPFAPADVPIVARLLAEADDVTRRA